MAEFFISVYEFFYTGFNLILAAFASFRIWDVIDIFIIAFVLYEAIILFRDTRSKQIVKGILILLLVWAIASIFDFVIIGWAFTKVVDYLVFAALILFHPELRRAIEKVGYSKFNFLGFGEGKNEDSAKLESINQICKAVGSMHENKVGALIVIERETSLNEIVSTGTVVDAKITPELICNVFYPKSPLHDGAMIIRNERVYAAACILPLTASRRVDKELGTRHRAAIGLSESADAVVVVVSEETGKISVVIDGKIKRGYNPQTLHEELKSVLVTETEDKTNENVFVKIKKKIKTKPEVEVKKDEKK